MHSSRRRRAGDIEWVNADARVMAGAEKRWTCSCCCGGRCTRKAEERARLWPTMRQKILVGAMCERMRGHEFEDATAAGTRGSAAAAQALVGMIS